MNRFPWNFPKQKFLIISKLFFDFPKLINYRQKIQLVSILKARDVWISSMILMPWCSVEIVNLSCSRHDGWVSDLMRCSIDGCMEMVQMMFIMMFSGCSISHLVVVSLDTTLLVYGPINRQSNKFTAGWLLDFPSWWSGGAPTHCGVFVVSSKDRWYFIDHHHHRHDDEMHEKSLNWHVINVNDWQIYQTGPLGVVLMARRQRWPTDLPSVRQKDAWLNGRADGRTYRQTDEGIRRWYKY